MSIATRLNDLEQRAIKSVDVAAILIEGRRRCRAGEPLPPSGPILGNSPLAKTLRAARKRCGINW